MSLIEINFNIDRKEWERYFSSISSPNLTQSWVYGEAKVKSQDWKVLRGIVTENKNPIALIQATYKKILFLKLVRISYGPLWIIKNPSLEQIKLVFKIIKSQWDLKKLSILSIAPNLSDSLENRRVLSELFFFRSACRSYESGLIDLSQTSEVLRANLRSNWRNQLKFSEKKQLIFESSNEFDDFKWIIFCFKKLRKEKNFYGHSVKFLEAFYQLSSESYETWIIIVSHHDEKVAGMLIAQSKSSCVPLIIWVSDKGRKLNAGNFLLWNSILYAKGKGCLWFDLGSTYNNKFKTGMPHEPFQLIGEYYGFI